MTDDSPTRSDLDGAPGSAVVRAVEALLFASGSALDEDALGQMLGDVGPVTIRAALDALARRYEDPACGLRVVRVSGGWQMRTAADLGDIVTRLRRSKPVRLSRAALETLSIVAYEQPVSRADVEALRGVDSSGILRSLLELDLIRVAGRREAVGRPLIYGTSEHFLHFFSLESLDALPRLREMAELEQAHLFDPDAYDDEPVQTATDGPAALAGARATASSEQRDATDADRETASSQPPADDHVPDRSSGVAPEDRALPEEAASKPAQDTVSSAEKPST